MRQLEDWVEAFYDYTDFLPSPQIFRRWAAISCIAGVLERKVWIRSQGSDLYPNMYTVLVAPPGVGKSVLTTRVEAFWRGVPDQFIASSSITKASLIDDLRDASRTVIRPRETPSTNQFNSLKILANELGVLLPSYESEFMSALTDIYDGSPYSERRRTKDLHFHIDKPQINLLAATTPSHMKDLLPEGAWDQGFLSRTMLIYSGDRVLRPLFEVSSGDTDAYKALQKDIKSIAVLYGEMKFTEEAARAITDWHMRDGPPKPDHPKLHNYVTRRTLHLLKLCMVACASSSEKLIITLEHYDTALSWLIEAEHFMPDIFKSMASSGDGKIIEECWFFVFQLYSRKKEPVPEAKVFQFLQSRVPSHSVERMVEVMVKAGLLDSSMENKIGRCFKPKEKHQMN